MREKNFRFIEKNVAVISDEIFSIYVVLDRSNFMIDCSVSVKVKNIHSMIKEILEKESEKKINTILLTHSHYDHVGGCSYFQYVYDAGIYASHRAVELLKKSSVVKQIRLMNQSFEKIMDSRSDMEFKMPGDLSGVGEGDKIDAGKNRYFEVFETPGHTKCSVSYLLIPDMILFPGDSAGFMDMDGKIKSFFFSSYKDYIGSIKKLSKIKAGILALPHNKYIRGEQRVKEYLKNSLNAAQELKDKILYYLEQNKSFEKTAEDLILEEFPFHSSIQDLIGSGDDLLSNFVRMVKSVSEESGD